MGDCVVWGAGTQNCDRWWDLDLWFAILWSLVKLLCELLAVGGGTNSLHEVHLASMPRWSFYGEVILVKTGAARSCRRQLPSRRSEGIHPAGHCERWGWGTWGSSNLCPTAPTNLWVDLDPLCECDPNTKYQPGSWLHSKTFTGNKVEFKIFLKNLG